MYLIFLREYRIIVYYYYIGQAYQNIRLLNTEQILNTFYDVSF